MPSDSGDWTQAKSLDFGFYVGLGDLRRCITEERRDLGQKLWPVGWRSNCLFSALLLSFPGMADGPVPVREAGVAAAVERRTSGGQHSRSHRGRHDPRVNR